MGRCPPTGSSCVSPISPPLSMRRWRPSPTPPPAARACSSAPCAITLRRWDELASQRLAEIGAQLHERWPICRAALLHATGTLRIGQISVVVAVSAPHRAEAFEACRFGIEELKRDVPIWKKEAFTTGEADWVMGA